MKGANKPRERHLFLLYLPLQRSFKLNGEAYNVQKGDDWKYSEHNEKWAMANPFNRLETLIHKLGIGITRDNAARLFGNVSCYGSETIPMILNRISTQSESEKCPGVPQVESITCQVGMPNS
jgi:hypothetical protein